MEESTYQEYTLYQRMLRYPRQDGGRISCVAIRWRENNAADENEVNGIINSYDGVGLPTQFDYARPCSSILRLP